MGVFLRWGVFGILAVAALVYAYNASKRLAELNAPETQVAQSEPDDDADAIDEEEEQDEEDEEERPVQGRVVDAEALPELPAACRDELTVAERALKMRRDGAPFDRLLRIQIIAFEEDAERRAHLEAVAKRWFEREGADPDAATLRREVRRDCVPVSLEP